MPTTTLASAANHVLDRLIAALTEPTERERSMVIALSGYLLVWTLYGIVAKSNQDLHPDMTELIAWSRDLALGFPKHPPFAAVILRGWFALFPVADWSYYLLAILTATIALWIAWQLFADYLGPTERVVALALLTFVPFFNFHALKYNVNTVLMPLWAATTLWFLRSYRTLNPTDAALAGVGAALCMASKYWSVFLLLGLVAAALSDSRRGAYFRSAAPWITLVTAIAIFSPHLGWLQRHNFSPVQYAMLVHGGHSVGEAVWTDLRYLLDAAAYVVVPIIVIVVAARPDLKTIADMAWPADPERRLVAVAFWTTLIAPIVPALVWGIEIHGIWSMSCWTLLPVLLLTQPAVKLSAVAVRGIVGAAVVLPFLMLAAAPAVAIAFHIRGIAPELAQARMLSAEVERAWRETTAKPLHYVGGALANAVLAYAPSRPQPLPDFPDWHTKRVAEFGIVLVCFAEDAGCIATSGEIAVRDPQSRRIEPELVRNYFGIAGPPQRYVIFIVPPED